MNKPQKHKATSTAVYNKRWQRSGICCIGDKVFTVSGSLLPYNHTDDDIVDSLKSGQGTATVRPHHQ